MSVYAFLETFAKLEKRLSEGLEGAAALRGQQPIQELRNKLDKFIRVLATMDIQVRRKCALNILCLLLILC